MTRPQGLIVGEECLEENFKSHKTIDSPNQRREEQFDGPKKAKTTQIKTQQMKQK